MGTAPPLGKDAILDAAAKLFDEEGVDAVSLNRINEASGHRNRSASTYHFGGKVALLRALVERSMVEPDARRTRLLDELEASGEEVTIAGVVRVLLAPLAESLDSPLGRRHLRLVGQLIGHPVYFDATQEVVYATPALTRCTSYIAKELEHLEPGRRLERGALMAGFVVRAFAEQARILDADTPPRMPLSSDEFLATMSDLVLAMLAAPVSAPDTSLHT